MLTSSVCGAQEFFVYSRALIFSKFFSAMAKGNPFLGDARGSVGDVTMYVKNGQQVTRVRRRSVANPSTAGQLIQRAILATVGKAYQAGAAIFDHSFEGVRVGAASQAKFQKENLNLIRSIIVADLNASHGDGQSMAAVVPRNAVYPVPNTYIISRGSLFNEVVSVTFTGDRPGISLPEGEEGETVQQFLSRLGVIDDDIFTACAFGLYDYDDTDPERYHTAYDTRFGFARFQVKTAALTSSTLVSAAKWGDIFEIEAPLGDAAGMAAVAVTEAQMLSDIVRGTDYGSIGVIRSRENSGLRSNSSMSISTTVEWGIIAKYIDSEWDPNAESAGDSSLILEGGGFQ